MLSPAAFAVLPVAIVDGFAAIVAERRMFCAVAFAGVASKKSTPVPAGGDQPAACTLLTSVMIDDASVSSPFCAVGRSSFATVSMAPS